MCGVDCVRAKPQQDIGHSVHVNRGVVVPNVRRFTASKISPRDLLTQMRRPHAIGVAVVADRPARSRLHTAVAVNLVAK